MIMPTNKIMFHKMISAALVLLLGLSAGSVWGGTIFATSIVDSTNSNFPASNVLGEPDLLVTNFFPEQGLPGYVIVSFDSAFADEPGNDIIIYVKDWNPAENEQFRVLAA